MAKTAPVPQELKMLTVISRDGFRYRLINGEVIDTESYDLPRRNTWHKNTMRAVQLGGQWYPVQYGTRNYYTGK